MREPSSERPVPLKLPRARAAAVFNSVADAAAAASVTPDKAISGARAERQAACAVQASESESSSQRAACAAQASESESSSSDPTGRSAVRTPSIERPVPLRLPRARAAAWIKSVADAAAAASVTPDRAISGARAEQRAACAAQASESESSSRVQLIESVADAAVAASVTPDKAISGARAEQRAACAAYVPLRLPRERAAAWIESVADAAVAASVAPDRAISGAHAEQRAARAAQAPESKSSSLDQERSRRSCGSERHTRQGDQRCASRAASGMCRSSF